MSYKNILSGYVNERKDGEGHYLVITNTSKESITIEPGEKLYMNRTPAKTLQEHPKVPHYSKSIKVEDQEYTSEEVAGDVPF